ncbi:sugar transporter [Streptomyces canarius]
MKRKLAAAIVIAGMMVSVSACGGDDGDDSGKDAGPDSFKGQTLTVWAIHRFTPDQWVKDVTAAFEKKTGAKLKFETQKSDEIEQKITTALSESTPPDVLEVGNTQPRPTRPPAVSPT